MEERGKEKQILASSSGGIFTRLILVLWKLKRMIPWEYWKGYISLEAMVKQNTEFAKNNKGIIKTD